MSTLTPKALQALRMEMAPLLAEIAKRHGVKLTVGSCRYTEGHATYKLEVVTINADGTENDKEHENFRLYAEAAGLDPKLLGKTFTYNGDTYRIRGLNLRKSKPVLCQKVGTEMSYWFKIEGVRKLMRIPDPTSTAMEAMLAGGK